MQRIVIIGAGGHAQVVADVLLRMRDAGADVQPVGYVDDNVALHGKTLLGLPVLGAIADVSSLAHDAVVVAIGSNVRRQRLFEQLRQQGEHLIIARHPTAIVAPNVVLGPGTLLCAGVIVNPGSVVGANVILNTGCTVDHHNHLGDHVHVAPGVHLGGEVVLETGTFVGIGATVMPQRRVGAWSIVGAGGLVHRDLPDHVVAVGVPARITKTATTE